VVLVEGDPWSSRDLAHNAAPFEGLAQVERESVERFVSEPCGGCRTWIVDPPRTGLSDAVRAAIGRDRPERVVYVSCDVATLARDVRALTEKGYEATALTGFDLFPSTAHVEAVCVLDRG
jgi:tRNA/tmRNA/rRNA uracil-C5-methylase (TrmA/RlmC/RlmD family)